MNDTTKERIDRRRRNQEPSPEQIAEKLADSWLVSGGLWRNACGGFC